MRKPKFIGELPAGDWQFCLVVVQDDADLLLVIDKTGRQPPRIVVDDKLIAITPQ